MPTKSDIFSTEVLSLVAGQSMHMIDLGARGGIDTDMLPLAAATIAIGFEPEAGEAEQLQRSAKGPWLELQILPHAIAKQTGPATLHLPREPEGASLLPHNEAMIEEFGHVGLHKTLNRVPVDAIALDDLIAGHGITSIDYLKVDIEGAELDILQGGSRLLSTCKLAKIECSFLEQRVGQPLAHEVIAYMAQAGFDLIDIIDLQRWRRRPLPSHPYVIGFTMPYSRGRISQADLMFARRLGPDTDVRDVSAAMLILSALGYVDQAITLLRRFPTVDSWWAQHEIDIEQEIQAASARLGSATLRTALRKQARGFSPLLRSWMGRLPFRTPERDY